MKTSLPIAICYLPGREQTYSRNRVMVAALRSVGFEVYDCSCRQRNIFRYVFAFFKFFRWQHKCQIVLVGFLGQFLIPFVRLFTKKKILFDVFVSVYQTMAVDRASFSPNGWLAKLAKFIDRLSCQLADHVLCDTNQNVDYFIREYRIDRTKFSRLFVGSDDKIFYPRKEIAVEPRLVHFHGEFQPLHGVEYIIQAAALLPEVQFQLIGQGKMWKRCFQMAQELSLQNIRFIPAVPYKKLPEMMTRAMICLGIFGNSPKARMVIPHKAFEAIALRKPLITANTPAARELFTHKQDAFLCPSADPQALAQAIRELMADKNLAAHLAHNGYQLFQEKCNPAALGREIVQVIQREPFNGRI